MGCKASAEDLNHKAEPERRSPAYVGRVYHEKGGKEMKNENKAYKICAIISLALSIVAFTLSLLRLIFD